jgi:hypothetical protein
VATSEQRREHEIDRVGLADDGFGNFGAYRVGELSDVFNVHA